ncbi:hypothetical protein A3E46_01065 [Candidatus Woesebacteria bacterium RIFCSPHIGHO2_12_FULL_46_16]|uniref:Uncharacterized protein n=1 Tax=Candidatus Woesebacteria bacterium RIFCSPHIGHO2_12_FULL_46_16 TaxID=1802513 RepID=A0A1F8B1G1_9BACT|nr:MAG: hypothetical protein A3E46_01065 [Candidatus Woesebacteria bacterium RIFCSPHIGHO2_12_FULL_46_16]
MALFPELGKRGETIQKIPQTPDIPPQLIKDSGIELVEPDTPANVKDAVGDLGVSPETQSRRIEFIPEEVDIETLAKGSPDNSSTWLGSLLRRNGKMVQREAA